MRKTLKLFAYCALCVLLTGNAYAGRLADMMRIRPETGREVSSFNGSGAREILIILDAHSNVEAQQNTARILAQFTAAFDSAVIGVEGACGDIDAADLRAFPVQPARDSVAFYFLDTSRINGVEYFLITADNDTALPLAIGIEDRKTYRDNLDAYRSFIGDAEGYAGEIVSFQAVLSDAAGREFTDVQREFDRLVSERDGGGITFSAYAERLADFARANRISLSSFVNFALLEKSFVLQKKISAYRLDAESKQIADKLNSLQLTDDAFRSCHYQYMLGTIAAEQYYTELARQCRSNQFDLQEFPQFADYLRYLDTTAQIHHAGLLEESEIVAEKVADALFAESPYRVVYEWKQRARLLKKACSLTISSAEYEMFAHDEGLAGCAESLGTLKAYLTDASSVAGIENTIQAIRAQSGVFYDIAHRRNEIMLANMLADMDMEDIQNGCLVVGGFHADGIAQLLEEKNVSYIVVSPAMSTPTDISLYHDRLKGNNTPFEASLEKSIAALKQQNQSTFPVHTLAVAAQLSRTPLDSEERAEAVRTELKSIMSVEAIRQLERSGLYQLGQLANRIDSLLLAQWGRDNFPDLRSYRIYRGLEGRLTIELNINNRFYTFIGEPQSSALSVSDPSRELAKITLGDTTITVLDGSDFQYSDAYEFAESLLAQLDKSPATITDIKTAAGVSAQTVDMILQQWQSKGYIFLGPAQNPQIVTLSPMVRQLLPVAGLLRQSFSASSDALQQLPDSLRQKLDSLNVKEILIGRTTPVPILLEFLMAVERGIIQPVHLKTGVTPFHLVDNNFTYDAVLAKRGTAQQGTVLELRVSANPAVPFDTALRDARLAEIIPGSSVLQEISQHEVSYVPLGEARPESAVVLPLSERAERERVIRNHLADFVGDPLQFKKIPKAVVFDLDGTLADIDAQTGEFLPIAPEIINEIKKLIANGVDIALITGQAIDGAQDRFARFFDANELSKIHLYSSSGANAVGFDENGQMQTYYHEDLLQVFTREQLDDLGNEITKIAQRMNISHYEMHMRDSVQLSYRLTEASEEERIAFFNAVSDLIQSKKLPVKIGLAGRTTIDIAVKNKSDAVRDFLQNRVQANPSDVLFFGDSYDGNDYPMAEAAPQSAHFHVGHVIQPDGLPDNVIQTDNQGPASTGAILAQLNQLIELTVERQLYEDRVHAIFQNNTAYYDFHRQFSSETPPDMLDDKFILPVWYHTNETEWEQAVSHIEQNQYTNTLLGVSASSVTLSYIAAGNFKQAVIIDTNPIVTQLYVPLRNALITMAANRIEFISLLSRKPIKEVIRAGEKVYQPTGVFEEGAQIPEISPTASIEEIWTFFRSIDPSQAFSENTFRIIEQFFPDELREPLAYLWDRNFRRGFSQQNILQTEYKADARAGKHVTWFSDESRFQKVRTFIQEGRLYGIEADWSTKTVAQLADTFAVTGDVIDAAYVSNVHHKVPSAVSEDGVKPSANYFSNIAAFPRSGNFIIISDRTLAGDTIAGVSPYENTAYEETNVSWRQKQFTVKPVQPMSGTEIEAARADAYSAAVRSLTDTYGQPSLGDYYRDSGMIARKEIMEFFARAMAKKWTDIRNRLIRGEIPQGNEKQLVEELESLFGIGLAQFEDALQRYDNPYDFFMQLLIQPYDTSRIFIQKTYADTLAELVRTVQLFKAEPDIVLIDSSLVLMPTNAGNFAAGSLIAQYRQEHTVQQGRRTVFAAVDMQADNVITARKELDRSLFMRGDDATVFDVVLALSYNPQSPEEKALYTRITEELGADLSQENLLAEFKRRKLSALIQQRFGIAPEEISARVSVISDRESFLTDLAVQSGMAFRVMAEQEPNVGETQPAGIFLIDVLRTIGDRSLPADLRITGVSGTVAVTPEQKQLGFDQFIELFRTVYRIYAGIEESARTYRGFIDALTAARADGTIAPLYNELLLPDSEIRQMFIRQADTPFHAGQLVAVFMQIVPTRLRVVDKIKLENSIQLQYKLLAVKSVIDRQTAEGKETVTIRDVNAQLTAAGIEMIDIASYLQVDVPPRPVSADLNKAIAGQRAFDLSA